MRQYYIKSIVFLCCYALSITAFSAPPTTYASNGTGGGDWVNNSSWSGSPGLSCATAGNDTYDIQGGDSIYTSCANLTFVGNVNIIIRSGGVFYVGGSGGITGNVDLSIEPGGRLIVVGNLTLGGSSDVDNNGSISVGGTLAGPGSTFDCDGSGGTGTVSVGGTGCAACTDGGASCSENTVLPIQLLSFSVSKLENRGLLFNWSTLTEENNSHFTIEISNNGEDFNSIAEIDGAGNSNEIINYLHEHPENVFGTKYFRLKQTDYDGESSVSHIVALEHGPSDMLVFPNPSEGKFDIIADGLEGDVFVQLLDVRGQEVYSNELNLDSKLSHLECDLHHKISSGKYVLRLVTEDNVQTEHIIIY